MNRSIIKTSDIVKMYFEENNLSINDLYNSGLVFKDEVNRFFNGDYKLNKSLASAINKLLPELSVDFLLNYDKKYNLDKENKNRNMQQKISM